MINDFPLGLDLFQLYRGCDPFIVELIFQILTAQSTGKPYTRLVRRVIIVTLEEEQDDT